MVLAAAREYLSAQREFLIVCERCSLKGWPEKKAALRMAFRLQELYCERQILRLKHLQSSVSDDAEWYSLRSISKIHERLEQRWETNEEEALCKTDSAYGAVQAEIRELKAELDPVGLEGPFAMLARDAENITARRVLAEKVRELDRELSDSADSNRE